MVVRVRAQGRMPLGESATRRARLGSYTEGHHMYYSLNSLKGGYIGDYIGDYYRGY